jgi:hypothetical protein
MFTALKPLTFHSDAVCNHFTCGYDHDDCGECAPGCSFDKLSNGYCEDECFTGSCAFDKDDCFASLPTTALIAASDDDLNRKKATKPPHKKKTSVPTNAPQQPKQLPEACKQTSATCLPEWIGDKYCDVIACGRECDLDDCQEIASTTTCSQTCQNSDLYNDKWYVRQQQGTYLLD